MKIPINKLKAIILYFCTYTNTKYLGKVKLMKLFYFLDFTHLKKYGAPVTYDNYFNLEHGPIPSVIKSLVDTATDDLTKSILSDTILVEKPKNTDMCRITCKRKFLKEDERYFSESEMRVLKQICEKFGNKDTQYIEEASHKESAWSKTKLMDSIPYELAAQDKDCKVTAEEIKMLMEI